jgi:hypothetical protein
MVVHLWLLIAKYRCGVVVNYNSDTFPGRPNATKCRNPELDGTNARPDRSAWAVGVVEQRAGGADTPSIRRQGEISIERHDWKKCVKINYQNFLYFSHH